MTSNEKHLEELAEINNTTFTQNVEWFSTDLGVAYKPRRVYMNIGYAGAVIVEITFDGGSSWTLFSDSKKSDFKDEINFIINPTDQINFRTSSGAGITVQHLHIYMQG